MLLCFNPYDHENFNTFQLVYFTMKFGSSIVTKRFASGNLAMKKKMSDPLVVCSISCSFQSKH